MNAWLAYAQGADTSDTDLVIIVVAILIAAVAGILAAIPFTLARHRRSAQLNGIAAVMVLWAILSAGSAIYFENAQISWSKEYNRRISSGYFDPTDKNDRPIRPWALWCSLAAIYCGTLIWSTRGTPAKPSGA